MILVGVRVHVRPVAGNIEPVRSTVPVKPLVGAIVIVEMPVSGGTVTIVGLAPMLKSGPAGEFWTMTVVVEEIPTVGPNPPKRRT